MLLPTLPENKQIALFLLRSQYIFLCFGWFRALLQRLFSCLLCRQVYLWVVTTHRQPLSCTDSPVLPRAWALPDLPRCQFVRMELCSSMTPPPTMHLANSQLCPANALPHPSLCSPGWGTLRLLSLCKKINLMRAPLFYLPFQDMASPTMDFQHTVELPSTLEPLNLTLG